MLPRTIHVIPGIVFAGLVPYPRLSVNVGSLGVSGPIGQMALRRSGVLSRPWWRVANGRGTAARRFAGLKAVRLGLSATVIFFLGEPHGGK